MSRGPTWYLKYALSYAIGFGMWCVLAPMGYVRLGGFATIAKNARYHADNWAEVMSGEKSASADLHGVPGRSES